VSVDSTTLIAHAPNLWSVEHQLGWQVGLVQIPVRMTVIRLRDGQLILHSPIPLSAALRTELDALGTVSFIVVPRAHGRFAENASRAYPEARLLPAPSPSRRRRALPFRDPLVDLTPTAWSGQVESLLLDGFRLQEVLLFHRPSRTLILTDLCFNIHHSSSPVARLFFRANKMWQHFGPSRVIRRVAISNHYQFQESLERAYRWDFERILPGHGEVIEQASPEDIRSAWPRKN
jgi:hypothetical protein